MLKNYINDYELLYYIRDKNDKALMLMQKKYEPLIIATAKKCGARIIDLDDYLQEGFICLNKAIASYNDSLTKTFTRYFELILNRRFWRIRKYEKSYVEYDLDTFKSSDSDFKEVVLEYASILDDRLDRDIFVEIFYYNTSTADVAIKYGIPQHQVYRRVKKIKEKILNEFDLLSKK